MFSSSTAALPSQSFSGTIQPTRVAPLYQAGLAVVALAMVMLPLVYVALIAAMGKLLWWHVTENVAILGMVRGRAWILALLVYAGPAVAGVIFILFLIKPLFSRSADTGKPFTVDEKDEPELFAFVRKICGLVGAPEPKEIRLDSQVNASAGFRRGWLSFFSNDLVLTIGMPLAAGMTVRQLAGVLAHEFGHFAQGAGMRMSYVIRRVNGWFARVVYERDEWDDKLDEWASTDDWRIQAIFKLAQGGVWSGRKVLWCLMQTGHAISCFMSRQMEFDADSYEAKVAGSTEFALTAERLGMLSVARGAAMQDTIRSFQQKELPEDLASLVAWRESVMPAEIRKQMEKHATESKTRWWDTHPCDADRVKAAAKLAAPGVFHLNDPAAIAFRDFPSLSRAVTKHFYEHEQGLALDKVRLSSADQMIADRKSADDAEKHLDEFYGKTFHVSRVLPLVETSADEWKEAAQGMKAGADAYVQNLARFNELAVKLARQSVGIDLLEARFSLSAPGSFDFKASHYDGCFAELMVTRKAIQEVEGLMAEFEQTAGRRLAAPLAGLQTLKSADGETLSRIKHLLTAQQSLAQVLKDESMIRRADQSLDLIFANAANHQDGPSLEKQAKAVAGRINMALKRALDVLGDMAHPYMSDGSTIKSSLHLAEEKDHEFAHAKRAAMVYAEGLLPLLVRIMGDLCGLALEAEKKLGDGTVSPGVSALV